MCSEFVRVRARKIEAVDVDNSLDKRWQIQNKPRIQMQLWLKYNENPCTWTTNYAWSLFIVWGLRVIPTGYWVQETVHLSLQKIITLQILLAFSLTEKTLILLNCSSILMFVVCLSYSSWSATVLYSLFSFYFIVNKALNKCGFIITS